MASLDSRETSLASVLAEDYAERPYWWDAANPLDGRSPTEERLDAGADVVIVGGGITGTVAALKLARAGAAGDRRRRPGHRRGSGAPQRRFHRPHAEAIGDLAGSPPWRRPRRPRLPRARRRTGLGPRPGRGGGHRLPSPDLRTLHRCEFPGPPEAADRRSGRHAAAAGFSLRAHRRAGACDGDRLGPLRGRRRHPRSRIHSFGTLSSRAGRSCETGGRPLRAAHGGRIYFLRAMATRL